MPRVFTTKNHYMLVAVLTAQFGILLNGTFFSWPSPVLMKLSDLVDNPLQRKITSNEQVWIVTIGVFGMWIGSFLSGELARRIGKRPTLILMTLPLIISFLILAFLRQIWLMYLARVLGGLTNGLMFTILPIYLGEVADSKSRGLIGAALNLFLNVGLLLSLCLGPYTTYRNFNLILAAVVFIYTILIALIIPETPYHLIEKNFDEAEKTLKKLRGSEDVKQELKQIQQYVELESTEKCSYSEILTSQTGRKSLIIGIGVCCFQQCTGITIIMTFGQIIFEDIEGFLPSDTSLILLGFSQVVFGLVAPIFAHRFGRRCLLISSYIGITISLFTFGLYFVLKKHGVSVDGISWLPLIAMIFFMFLFGIGAGAVTYIVISEIFSSKIKGIASSIANTMASITGVVIINVYKISEEQIGIGYSFWLLGLLGVLGAIFSACFIIETRGKSLKEIQEIFHEENHNRNQMVEL